MNEQIGRPLKREPVTGSNFSVNPECVNRLLADMMKLRGVQLASCNVIPVRVCIFE